MLKGTGKEGKLKPCLLHGETLTNPQAVDYLVFTKTMMI